MGPRMSHEEEVIEAERISRATDRGYLSFTWDGKRGYIRMDEVETIIPGALKDGRIGSVITLLSGATFGAEESVDTLIRRMRKL